MEQSDSSHPIEMELEKAIMRSIEENRHSDTDRPSLPEKLHVFPLLRRPFFPGMAAPIAIEPGPYYEVLKQIARSEAKSLALVLAKREDVDIYKANLDDLFRVGVLARVLRIIPMEQGGAQVILNMERRIVIEQPVRQSKGLVAKVSYPESRATATKELKAYAISIISTIRDLLKLNPLFKEELQIFLSHSDYTEPGKLADFSVALTTATREEMQEVLETIDVEPRIEKALILLKKELDLSQLQNSINQKIEATISRTQRDYFLREQMKTIRKELGIEKDEKSADRDKFEARLKERTVPPDVATVIKDEMDKLSVLEPQSAEYSVCRGYLEWLTIIPWGIYSKECHDLRQAERVLHEDHYGLEDIKQRILEFIGVGKLAGGVRGSILCLVGPPGVGKTSIGRSIARALNRKFYRFSVGGMRDEAEIKGHRRTYIGSMPGKPIQALKVCKTMNPVIMLDEVDKMGISYQGDPASALLEVLDPEQNKEFLDHYLDVRCNLSDVLFVCTANVLDTIPEPLKDRMDILRLSGYILQEKIEIARKYLIPRNRKEMGLKALQISFNKDALRMIINGYAREAGVRTLENDIKKILRKVAIKVVRDTETQTRAERRAKRLQNTGHRVPKLPRVARKHIITAANVKDYLGKPRFTSDRYYHQTPVGVCTGLAWTALGGATLYVEAIKVAGEKTGMKLTGQAGEVMKESAEIAWSYLHSAIHKYAPGYTFFEKQQVHIHIPEGATPKDGPSAGITMVTALLSLLTDNPVIEDLGMTGELTLTGRVLPVGGIKEKLVAARRSGLKSVIFPKDNLPDYDQLPEYLRQGMGVYFVDHYDEVYPLVFAERR